MTVTISLRSQLMFRREGRVKKVLWCDFACAEGWSVRWIRMVEERARGPETQRAKGRLGLVAEWDVRVRGLCWSYERAREVRDVAITTVYSVLALGIVDFLLLRVLIFFAYTPPPFSSPLHPRRSVLLGTTGAKSAGYTCFGSNCGSQMRSGRNLGDQIRADHTECGNLW